ncbi:hypothetical protein PB01_07080 [Psychrobacillus glaciei]|uniref:Lipoprotein n=1 Tax=Psychrobacillus glaciei TaxID=2283160 RepID=A0A5J6SMD1_9BACI|nr:hypothetical protein [Psychrobacillus glaciei]QFF98613.1 hypothetical protein PB01_07080 [Psychrobacillus glaciei]
MKRILIVISLALLVVCLGACNKEIQSTNTLAEAKLTDKEKFLLSSTSDKSFVFDYKVDKKYKQVSLWVDKYEFGKLVEEKLNNMLTEIDGTGMIIFSTSQTIAEQKESTINISVNNYNGFSTIRTQLIIPKVMQSTWGSNPSEYIPIADKMVLASICYSNGHGMSSLTNDFYSDIDNRLYEIKDYDVVYVLRAEFLDK